MANKYASAPPAFGVLGNSDARDFLDVFNAAARSLMEQIRCYCKSCKKQLICTRNERLDINATLKDIQGAVGTGYLSYDLEQDRLGPWDIDGVDSWRMIVRGDCGSCGARIVSMVNLGMGTTTLVKSRYASEILLGILEESLRNKIFVVSKSSDTGALGIISRDQEPQIAYDIIVSRTLDAREERRRISELQWQPIDRYEPVKQTGAEMSADEKVKLLDIAEEEKISEFYGKEFMGWLNAMKDTAEYDSKYTDEAAKPQEPKVEIRVARTKHVRVFSQ